MSWGAGLYWSESSRAWCGFVKAEPDNCLLLRHELTWRGVAPEDAAKDIVRRCGEWGIAVPAVYAQPELFPTEKSRGETVSATFRSCGVSMRQADDDRINGWSRVRSWMRARTPDGRPRFRVHEDCKYFRKTFPTLIQDPAKPDDVLETTDEYPANGLRFYLMSRPSPFVTVEPEIPKDSIYWDIQAIRDANDQANRVD